MEKDVSMFFPGSPCSTHSMPFAAPETKLNSSPFYRTYTAKVIVQTLMREHGMNQV
jgi:hypothetical protein